MAPTKSGELAQSQSLVMTPQLQQAIKLLQLSNLELAAEVDRELEQNPLLDRDESANDSLLEGPSADQRDTVGDSLGKEDAAGGEAASEPEAAAAEIGSAASRERVRQYVAVSVGAVSLTTKH